MSDSSDSSDTEVETAEGQVERALKRLRTDVLNTLGTGGTGDVQNQQGDQETLRGQVCNLEATSTEIQAAVDSISAAIGGCEHAGVRGQLHEGFAMLARKLDETNGLLRQLVERKV